VADAYVCDAFAAAHRNSPTLSGFGAALPCIAGVLMQRELEVLGSVIDSPLRPQTIILGGVKVDDSLDIAQNLLQRGVVDTFVPVGAVGNLMLMADGRNLGTVNSGFLETALGAAFGPTLELAKTLLADHSEQILLPIDLAVEQDGQRVPISVEDLPTTAPIYDIGIETLMLIRPKIMQVGCVLWNGPASYFEKPEFAFGTVEILNSCCESPARVIIGGGHTGAIVSQRGVAHLLDHNSTGGGSCLTFLAGKRMPAVEALQRSHELFRPDLSRR
jgi:phosphoglycerate kinase